VFNFIQSALGREHTVGINRECRLKAPTSFSHFMLFRIFAATFRKGEFGRAKARGKGPIMLAKRSAPKALLDRDLNELGRLLFRFATKPSIALQEVIDCFYEEDRVRNGRDGVERRHTTRF
jgi:hypothetical protein